MRTTKAFITEPGQMFAECLCLGSLAQLYVVLLIAIVFPIHYSQSKSAISLILIPAPKGIDSVNEQKAITSMVLKLCQVARAPSRC